MVEIDVVPPEPKKFSLSHPRFEGDKAERAVGLVMEVLKKLRKLVVLEVRGLLSLRPRLLRRRQFANWIRFGVAVVDGCLQTGAQDT
jgi:hypothetical protein